jgi:hypothetical protein
MKYNLNIYRPVAFDSKGQNGQNNKPFPVAQRTSFPAKVRFELLKF